MYYVHLIKAYDSHCNLVLGDVDETIYVVDDNAEEGDDEEQVVRVWFLSIFFSIDALD